MKHKSIDLASEVKRATLPDGLPGFLFPVFEAISNALHSLEERWGSGTEVTGQVEIDFSSDERSITISDSGVGFDAKNLNAFLTPLTGNKFERGGKGFGRFIAFKLFDNVFYSSRQFDQGGASTAGTYRYDPFATDDNLIEIPVDDGGGPHRFDGGLTARMMSPRQEVSRYFDPKVMGIWMASRSTRSPRPSWTTSSSNSSRKDRRRRVGKSLRLFLFVSLSRWLENRASGD